jgi:hypothetical protein
MGWAGFASITIQIINDMNARQHLNDVYVEERKIQGDSLGTKPKKRNVYLPSLRMKVLDHVYILGHSYACYTLMKNNGYA